ncbi:MULTISPECIES: malate synthase A [Prauserella salsuginis group]|uniref:Malate synthase n=2 Tax=Prauserella salsuginis group TaxID=2893672 RepID=A0A839XBT2_9PSEU|nr:MULTISPECIES: malate synthase A [Prauserella salsuginis group]MBB3661432.1 malate synthase [Prauserella sediminis]MCR3719353.1 malate synthase [Prauserella flava]MCR3735633.1 malate synthase [Prauserella salsuginis]
MSDVRVLGDAIERGDEVLTQEALDFVAGLHENFAATRDQLLEARKQRREEAKRTGRLDFLSETKQVRESDWQVADAPPALRDRRVEITGPTERKMTINALNSGAKVWLADLEDANTPHWSNVVNGQINLSDAIRGTIELESNGKHYALRDDVEHATIVVRPRGWHLDERNLEFNGRKGVGALVDFGLHFFHNAKELLARGKGPYYYLPKMESHLEARLWNDIFTHAEKALGVEHGTIRATVLIETIPAAFEMEEILYELREHASGLNAGRWDYLFSVIKYFRDAGEKFVLPDRNAVTMTAPFMRAYTELLVRTCHKRGAFAIGGMSAFIPSKDPEVAENATKKVHADKSREAGDGFDGSWVAHPGMVGLCKEEFDKVLGDKPNQLDRLREDVSVTADQLLDVAATDAQCTAAGLRGAVDVGVRYIASWLGGNGAAGIHNLMEDAATAEISRSQVWQWVQNSVVLADTGATVTRELVRSVLDEIKGELADEIPSDLLQPAVELFEEVALADEFADFLTLPAYERIK